MILFQSVIKRDDALINSSVLYVFGDNEQRVGRGGLAAELRGLKNSHGIRTKAKPSTDPSAYWSDNNYSSNVAMLEEDFLKVRFALARGILVVFPAKGLGTGLSAMPKKCPRTYNFLTYKVDEFWKTYNDKKYDFEIPVPKRPTNIDSDVIAS